MIISAILASLNRRRRAYVATIAGILLGTCAMALPAYSGDYYGYGGYSPGYYGGYGSGYYGGYGSGYRDGYPGYGAYPASYSHCGYKRCGCGYHCARPVRYQSSVFERRFVEREYTERRFPGSTPYYGASYAYPSYGYPSYRSARFPWGYGGVRYLTPPYEGVYGTSYETPYGYGELRPPASVPSVYYNEGYE